MDVRAYKDKTTPLKGEVMDIGATCYHRFLEGDNSGLEQLVEMYNSSLVFYINGLVNNVATAEDIAADTFVELLVKKSSFKNDYAFKTWLFRVARNNSIDYLRKQARIGTFAIDDCGSQLLDSQNLEKAIIQSEQHMQMHQAMKLLNNDYRDVLHLVCLEGLSYDQAGVVLKKNTKQIKNLVYRARQALKLEMERKGFIYENL